MEIVFKEETIGIIYESSMAHMTLQAVKLTDIIKKQFTSKNDSRVMR